MTYKRKKIGRWEFYYRNPAKTKWYIIWHPLMRNTPVVSIWRFGACRRSK